MPLKPPEDEGHPVDRIIREAMAEGQFENLEGQGRPLPMDFAPDPWRAAFGLLKNAGFAPEWVELERAIEDARSGAAAALDRYAEERASALAAIERLRERPAAAAKERHLPLGARLAALVRRDPTAERSTSPVGCLAAAVQDLNAARDRVLRHYLRRLHTINRMVDRLNLVHPLRGSQQCREEVARAGRRFAERFPRGLHTARSGAPGGPTAIEWIPGAVPPEWLRPPELPEDPSGRVRGEVQAEALVEYRRRRREGIP